MVLHEGSKTQPEGGREVYRAAIVGCGQIGCFFDDDPKRQGIWTHAGAYAACPQTKLTALADVDAAARERAARRWGVSHVYPDLESMLRDERVDILSVCTPSNAHAFALRAVATAGVPAVWCEKPMTITLQEADEVVALSRTQIVAVNHTRRWDGAYETAREWIQQGGAGKLVAATAWYTHGVANIGSHLFDTLRFLLGETEWAWAAPDRSGDADPTLSGVVGFAGGVVCHVIGCGRDLLLFEIDLVGSEGRLRISENGTRVEARAMEPSSRYSGYREPGAPTPLWKGQDERRMLTAVEDIVRCLDKGGEPRCTGRDGLKAIEMVTAFLQSAEMEKRVELPLVDLDRRRPIPVR
jgi:predicted dehydrogenase